MKSIEQELDELAKMQLELEMRKLQFDELRNKIIPQEIKQSLDDLDFETKNSLEPMQEKINELTAKIKADVLTEGRTVTGKALMAVWNKGRVSWDTSFLDGYSIAHPEILPYKKSGQPSVSIRNR